MKVFCADCHEFDNHRTGYYATAEEAITAFWEENHFSKNEAKEVQVYAVAVEVTAAIMEDAQYKRNEGSPSPALGISL